MADENSNTQESQTQADTAQTPGSENQIPQSRFDQVYAQAKQSEERAAQMEARVNELVSQMAVMAQAAVASRAAPQEPEVEIDPEEEKRISHVTSRKYNSRLDRIEQSISQLVGAMNTMRSDAQVRSLPLPDDRIPPEVKARAEKVVKEQLARGVPYNMADALKHAFGEYAMAQAARGAQGAAARRAQNQGVPPPLAFQSGTGSVTAEGASPDQPKPLPANFDQLAPKEQIKLLKQLRPGLQNQPI